MPSIRINKPSIAILDLDGTTIPIGFFVHTLLPYIHGNLEPYLIKNWGTDNLNEIIELLREDSILDRNTPKIPSLTDSNDEHVLKATITNVFYQLENRKKSSGIFSMFFMVWMDGFSEGRLKGKVFDDVPEALHLWKRVKGMKIHIFSSGMIEMQQCTFLFSEFGNLDSLIKSYLNTVEIGPKNKSQSYVDIAKSLGERPHNMMFLTDSVSEAEAAKDAGYQAILVRRPGNRKISQTYINEFPLIDSFLDIHFNS